MHQQPQIVGMGEQRLAVGFRQQRELRRLLFRPIAQQRLRVGLFQIRSAGLIRQESQGRAGFVENLGQVPCIARRPQETQLDWAFLRRALGKIAHRESEDERRHLRVFAPFGNARGTLAMRLDEASTGRYLHAHRRCNQQPQRGAILSLFIANHPMAGEISGPNLVVEEAQTWRRLGLIADRDFPNFAQPYRLIGMHYQQFAASFKAQGRELLHDRRNLKRACVQL